MCVCTHVPLIEGTAPSCHVHGVHGSGGTVAATAQDETARIQRSASSTWRSGWGLQNAGGGRFSMGY